jgi:NmrA-like family
MPGFFMLNLKTSIKTADDGSHSLTLPFPVESTIPMLDVAADTGKFVAAVLSKPKETLGRNYLEAAAYYSPLDIQKSFKEATGKELKYNAIPMEVFGGFLPESKRVEIVENFTLIRDWKYYGLDGEEKLVESLKVLEEPLTSLKEWFEKNGPW